MAGRTAVIPVERIESRILLLRGHKVMLSTDLATLYDVQPQLTTAEFANLKSQIVTSSWGGLRRATPYAFTEQGVAMLSSVLRSRRAVLVNIEIMRAFVRLRQMLASRADLARKLDALEKKYDAQFKMVFDAIRELMNSPAPRRHPIGFRADS